MIAYTDICRGKSYLALINVLPIDMIPLMGFLIGFSQENNFYYDKFYSIFNV